jgi:predicted phosphodiesterase
MKITVISDTHTNHHLLTKDLPGGDLLIFAGDLMNSGYNEDELYKFCSWFNSLDDYDSKVFIAGNHDRFIQNNPGEAMQIINSFKWINYLQDDWINYGKDVNTVIKLWGSPWQPEFMNWAFNLLRNGKELERKWNLIPEDVDILITHGPPFGHCDTINGRSEHLGCELLRNRVYELKPKIHIFGHIHSGYGYCSNGCTHFINASVSNERYSYKQLPLSFEWDNNTNEIDFK